MLWRGGTLHAHDVVEVGTVIAFIQYIQQFFVPIRDFSAKYAVMQSSMTAAERIFALLDETVEPVAASPEAPAVVRGAIEFDHVWFAYKTPEGASPSGCSATSRSASRPASRSPSWARRVSGKTTIIKLLDRLYTAQHGRILVDGVDVRDWDAPALRRRIAVVLQDVFLFSGTVADNVTLGTPGIDRARVEAASRYVHADEFIERMGGYDAEIRERGSNLSTGQRQLLAFARALAHDPAVLVMDEATSSVDPETEWLVQDALAKLLAGRTAVVIAHRLSTIEHSDRILVLHKGQLARRGDPRGAPGARRHLRAPLSRAVRARAQRRSGRRGAMSRGARRTAVVALLAACLSAAGCRTVGYPGARRSRGGADPLAPRTHRADAGSSWTRSRAPRAADARFAGARVRRDPARASRRRQLLHLRRRRRYGGRLGGLGRASRPASSRTPGGIRSSAGCRIKATSSATTPSAREQS